jgi:hypothetical protein
MGRTLCFRPYSGMFGLSSILTTVWHIFYHPRPFYRQTRTKHTSAAGSSKAMFTMIGWSAGGGKHQQAWRILAGRVDLLCVSITSNDSHFLRHCLVSSTALKAYHYTYFYVLIRFSIHKLIGSIFLEQYENHIWILSDAVSFDSWSLRLDDVNKQQPPGISQTRQLEYFRKRSEFRRWSRCRSIARNLVDPCSSATHWSTRYKSITMVVPNFVMP